MFVLTKAAVLSLIKQVMHPSWNVTDIWHFVLIIIFEPNNPVTWQFHWLVWYVSELWITAQQDVADGSNGLSSGYHSSTEDGSSLQQQLSAVEVENQLLRNEVSSLNQEMQSVIRRMQSANEGAHWVVWSSLSVTMTLQLPQWLGQCLTLSHVLYTLQTLTCCLFLVFALSLPPVALVLQLQSGTHFHMAFITLPLPILSVAFLKLTASSRPLAPPSISPKCIRFGHWLTLSHFNFWLSLSLRLSLS